MKDVVGKNMPVLFHGDIFAGFHLLQHTSIDREPHSSLVENPDPLNRARVDAVLVGGRGHGAVF